MAIKIIKTCAKWLLSIIIGCLGLLLLFDWLADGTPSTHNVSNDSKYAPIYKKRFCLQKDLFLCASRCDGDVFLDKRSHSERDWAYSFAVVEKGTIIHVKKILLQTHAKGKYVEVLVEIKDRRFSDYQINAIELILNWQNLLNWGQTAEFDPEYLIINSEKNRKIPNVTKLQSRHNRKKV